MPKKKQTLKSRQTVNVTGLSIQDILDMNPEDILKMKDADLTAIGKRLVSASNKRIRRLLASPGGEYSPALKKAPKEGFSVDIAKGGTHRNKVLSEVTRMREFLSKKTSSVRGFTKVRKYFNKHYKVPLDPEKSSKFWKVYRAFEEEYHATKEAMKSEEAVKAVARVYRNSSEGDLWENIKKMAEREYEKAMAKAANTEEEDDEGDDDFNKNVEL